MIVTNRVPVYARRSVAHTIEKLKNTKKNKKSSVRSNFENLIWFSKECHVPLMDLSINFKQNVAASWYWKKKHSNCRAAVCLSEFQLVLEQMWAFCVLVTICSITQSSPWNDDPSVRFALPRRARLRRRHRTIRYNTPSVHVLGQVSRTRPRCRSKRAKQKSLRGLPGYGARLKVCRLNSKGRSKSKVW